jgi:hypothetical protein
VFIPFTVNTARASLCVKPIRIAFPQRLDIDPHQVIKGRANGVTREPDRPENIPSLACEMRGVNPMPLEYSFLDAISDFPRFPGQTERTQTAWFSLAF